MVFAQSLKGTDGRVTYPAVGALIGEMWSWQLYTEDQKSYVLKAKCKHLHEMLWEEVGPSRRIELRISKDKWLEARPTETAVVLRNGRDFTIKGVLLKQIGEE
jgi:hypothetical protein